MQQIPNTTILIEYGNGIADKVNVTKEGQLYI